MNILEKIVLNKKKELKAFSSFTSVKALEETTFFSRDTVSLSNNLSNHDNSGIIAEFKRRSPSKGIINSASSVEEVTSGYFREGASGVSVLTDIQFFGGTLADLISARINESCPILRKDFIIDEYQVLESKSIGADCILLIAAILNRNEILRLSGLARSIGLEVLLEIHEPDELDKVNHYINIIGVNNRSLKSFDVNTDISLELADKIPADFLKISESGLSSAETVKKLRASGYNGFLMGEKFMSSADPVKAFSEFVKDLLRYDQS